MTTSRLLAAALIAGAVAAPTVAQDRGDPEMVQKIRALGLGIGNAYVCTPEDARDVFKEQAHHMFDLIVQDVGSDLGFIYAAGVGYGSAVSQDLIDCEKMLAQWSEVVTTYELESGE